MAGSYQHILDEDGEIVSNEEFVHRIENLGDAYEMAVDMHEEIKYANRRLSELVKQTSEVRQHILKTLR